MVRRSPAPTNVLLLSGAAEETPATSSGVVLLSGAAEETPATTGVLLLLSRGDPTEQTSSAGILLRIFLDYFLIDHADVVQVPESQKTDIPFYPYSPLPAHNTQSPKTPTSDHRMHVQHVP